MKFKYSKIFCVLFVSTVCVGGVVHADQAPIARMATNSARSVRSVPRQALSNTERSVSTVRTSSGTARSAIRSDVKRSSNNRSSNARSATTTARTGVLSNIVRAAKNTKFARSAVTSTGAGLARATAVFNDVSKIGSGYANCRDAYATCMDQFCANANDTYRRCFCSSKYSQFRDTEDALEEALTLLAKFEDNNLNAVDKTAEEVNAMYSATAGEMAIKNDTSGAAQMLSEIGELLSGKKSAKTNTSYTSLNGTSIDFDSDIQDIWAVDTSMDGIFGSSNKVKDISTYEGVELYNSADEQCLQAVQEACANDAVLSMAKSSYSIMISQDCNAYSKKIDSKREKVENTVRTAEKYLREARLEEYRSHNSADMNACITAVRNAIQTDTACGSDYVRCLDNTGVFINSTTGEPIYSPRLFQLNDLIKLDGTSDALGQVANKDFEAFLDSKRKYAETALDSCRDIAEEVWTEFKRSALIEISQAQDDKIEQVKMSCVQTVSECYDTQLGGLKEMDTSKLQMSGVAGVQAARDMCADKLIACASLYGDTSGCKFDGNGKLTNASTNSNGRCGLDSLLAFVDTVDTSRMSEACDTTIDNYLKDLCTPDSGEYGYPYKCRQLSKTQLTDRVQQYASQNCKNASETDTKWQDEVDQKIEDVMTNLAYEMFNVFEYICETQGGVFVDPNSGQKNETRLGQFYQTLYGNKDDNNADHDTWGICVQNTVETRCELLNTSDKVYATYNKNTGKCEFKVDYYEYKCSVLNGVWDETINGCYIDK